MPTPNTETSPWTAPLPHRQPTIFVDMDEVLTDFVGSVCRMYGVTEKQVDDLRPDGEWSIVPSLRQLGKCPNNEEMWRDIHSRGPDFWSQLPVVPDADKVISMVSAITDEWYILSAPSDSIYSRIGKIQWIKRVFGPRFDRFLLTPHKHLVAGPGRILIDDRPDNVHRFQELGGTGILYPHGGNSNAHFIPTRAEWLRVQLESLCPVETFHQEWQTRIPSRDAAMEEEQLRLEMEQRDPVNRVLHPNPGEQI